jgi:hypothetical protein
MLRDLYSLENVYFFRFSGWYFQSFIFGLILMQLIETNGRKNLFELIYWVCFFGAFLSFLLITIPSFDSWYKSIVIVSDFDRYDSFVFRYRNYGISENLSFTYSFVMGFFGAYTLTIINKNWFLIIPFLFFVIAVSFNARIGYVPILCIIIYYTLSIKKSKNIFLTFFLFLIIFLISTHYNSDLVEKILSFHEWKLGLFYEISDLFFKTNFLNSESNLDIYFNQFIIFPGNALEWIFGTGKSLFGGYEQSSDIGYILQLYYGGIIFFILIVILMLYMSFRLYKNFGIQNWFFILFVISIFVLNFKGFVFAATPGGRLLFLMYYYFIITNQKKCAFDR